MSAHPPQPQGMMPFQGPEVENLIKCNQKLKELGIESTIKLPQICVVGDQSAGKSSLIEALSMIKVPRAANCCTQCPLAINISAGERKDSPWKCTVKIEERYAFDRGWRKKQPTTSRPMGPWVAQQLQTHTFYTTYNKSDVCDLISAAQLAILNPGKDHRDYIPQEDVKLPTGQIVQFSPNEIRLDISEGDWPSLSFVDLPGVIANTTRKEDSFLIKLVRNLVKDYADKDATVIILTLPMTNDFANSVARHLVQELGAEPRTTAVLTKPDLLRDDESRKQFMDKFLEVENPEYGNSYHMVMMPPDTQMRHEDARIVETQFFMKEPWALIDEKFRGRLGVESLRTHIREVLFTKTRETLPRNLLSIEGRLANIHTELQKIPPPPDTKRLPLTLIRLLGAFADKTEKLFTGTGHNERLVFRSLWKKRATVFRMTLINARPTLFIRRSSEVEELRQAEAAIRRAIRAAKPPKKPVRADQSAEEISDGDSGATESKREGTPPDPESARKSKEKDLPHRFNLDAIRELNHHYETHGLPGQSHPQALQEMMQMSVKNWHIPMNDFLHDTSKLVNQHMEMVTKSVFEEFAKCDLYSAILKWVKNYLDYEIQNEWSRAESQCDVEIANPYTLDAETVAAKAKVHFVQRMGMRKAFRVKLSQTISDAECAPCKGPKFNPESLPEDEYETEVDMSCDVRAYYDVASARFADIICQSIIARLFSKCSTNLARDLEAYLGLDDESKLPQLQQWMAQDPKLERARQELIRERDRLIEGKAYILNAMGTEDESFDDPEPRTPSPSKHREMNGFSTPSTKRTRGLSVEPPSTQSKLRRMGEMTLNTRRGANDDAMEVDEVDH